MTHDGDAGQRGGRDELTIGELLRTERGPVLATLIRFTGDIGLAEDAVQEALLAAVQTWPSTGRPRSPSAWLITTARNKALDRIRREASRSEREREATLLALHRAPVASGAVRDDQLRLLFTVCHPALSLEAQIALALRTLGGLTTAEIARAFLVSEPTMGQRISRAKAKIAKARIPYRVPEDHELPARLPGVLHVVSATFTTGHHAPLGAGFDARVELCTEAMRLAELLVELMPDEPEGLGLLALLLAGEARRAARAAPDGTQVLLAEQDRTRWDHAAIARAGILVETALRMRRLGPFQLQAAIACAHGNAARYEDTDWEDIAALYRLLERYTPTVVVTVNRAVAEAMASGPAAGLDLLDSMDRSEVGQWFRYWATKAELHALAGQRDEAHAAWDRALGLDMNDSDRAHLVRRRAQT